MKIAARHLQEMQTDCNVIPTYVQRHSNFDTDGSAHTIDCSKTAIGETLARWQVHSMPTFASSNPVYVVRRGPAGRLILLRDEDSNQNHADQGEGDQH